MPFVSAERELFQSAPLTEARGDACFTRRCRYRALFQSAPLTEARGDREAYAVQRSIRRFNPLPLPKQGEMKKTTFDAAGLDTVSIRSPYRSKGRCWLL